MDSNSSGQLVAGQARSSDQQWTVQETYVTSSLPQGVMEGPLTS